MDAYNVDIYLYPLPILSTHLLIKTMEELIIALINKRVDEIGSGYK